ncbi:hypothetical protein [Francisella salimarina]|uniref:hypothetical protein n=1 Tax=Francisella salimarina TaxID=2599927 RepID=UPI003D8190A1
MASKDNIERKINNKVMQKVVLVANGLFCNVFNSDRLKKKIAKLKNPTENSMWSNYHDNIDPSTDKRFLRIKEIIDNLKDATSITEVASNQGKFAEFIYDNTHIEKVIATDYDKEAVNIMYNNNKDRDDFLTLLIDMVRNKGRIQDQPISDRMKGDIVIALAVTHHLVLSQDIPIEYIFEAVSKLANKYVIVEFMPIGLYDGNLENIPKLPEYYNLEWFRDNFKEYFELILDEEIQLNRHVFLGKVKINECL